MGEGAFGDVRDALARKGLGGFRDQCLLNIVEVCGLFLGNVAACVGPLNLPAKSSMIH